MWEYILPAAVSGIGALVGSNASKAATQAQVQAAGESSAVQSQLGNRALDLQQQQFDLGRSDLAPYREAGTAALGTYAGEVNRPFDQTPGYQARFNEGVRASDAGAGARGLLDSGARLKALTRFGADQAEQGYGTYANRLAGLAGVGQTATQAGVAQGQGFAGQASGTLGSLAQGLSQTAQFGGQAQAAGAVGQANAINSGIQNGTLLYALGMGR